MLRAINFSGTPKITFADISADSFVNGGFAYSSDGLLHVKNAGAAVTSPFYVGGLAVTANGALYITLEDTSATARANGGVLCRDDGAVYARSYISELVANLFGANDGALYDPSSISSLNQLSTGTTPVTAVTDPVGLVLDSRFGLVLGPELVDTINTAAAWTAFGTNTVEQDGDAIKVTYVDNQYGADAVFSAAAGLNSNLTIGANYKITYDIKVNSGSCNVSVYNAITNNNVAVTSTSYITQSFVFTASSASTNDMSFVNMSAGEIVWIKNISVKLLEGNHALQATAAARPTWEVDAQGNHYLKLLGIDDSLTSATGGGGSAGFFWCGVIEPTGGAGTLRTIWADNGTNTGYKVQLDASNKLSFSAGNNTAFTTKASTATLTTKSLATVWDDGTNLNVQINAVAAETVGRPVVVAGTAGYTVGKDNGAASSFAIINKYPSFYAKNTGLTATQRSNVQSLIRSLGGMS